MPQKTPRRGARRRGLRRRRVVEETDRRTQKAPPKPNAPRRPPGRSSRRGHGTRWASDWWSSVCSRSSRSGSTRRAPPGTASRGSSGVVGRRRGRVPGGRRLLGSRPAPRRRGRGSGPDVHRVHRAGDGRPGTAVAPPRRPRADRPATTPGPLPAASLGAAAAHPLSRRALADRRRHRRAWGWPRSAS